jgi:hypothetical protein
MDEAYTAITGASYNMTSTGGSADSVAQSMANSLAAGNAVTASTLTTEPAGSPIVADHAYNVHSVTNVNGTWYVTVYNPWGWDGASWDSNAYDGLLTITAAQFQSWFNTVEVCFA